LSTFFLEFQWSSYQFAGNTPIWAIDFDGLQPVVRTAILNGVTYTFTWNREKGSLFKRGKINGQVLKITNDVNDEETSIDFTGSKALVQNQRSSEPPDKSKAESEGLKPDNVNEAHKAALMAKLNELHNGVKVEELLKLVLQSNASSLQLLIIGNHQVTRGVLYTTGNEYYRGGVNNEKNQVDWTVLRAQFVKTYYFHDMAGIETLSRYKITGIKQLKLNLPEWQHDPMGINLSFNFEKQKPEKTKPTKPIRLTPRYL